MTYKKETRLFTLTAYFLLLLLIGVFVVQHKSQAAYESLTKVESSINSQDMNLLSANFGTEIPKAIGGPDAPYLEHGFMHAHLGFASTKTSQVEQDEYGISYYIVQEGDTISEIAELFNVSTNTIIWENDLGKSIKIGQELKILPVTGVRHKVAKGDSISKIAQNYDVQEEDITVYNGIDESKLVIGEYLIVPNGAKKKAPISNNTQVTSSQNTGAMVGSRGYFIRPTSGTLTSKFGPRSRGYHYGVDYGAPTGTPIVASASGRVLKTSCGSGYGKCLVIEHDNGTQTLYAHASTLYVSAGTMVKQGQKIAAVGSTGRSTGPHLHFEIIKSNGQKINPSAYFN